MTISEAIRKLIALLVQHGDIDIRIQVARYNPLRPIGDQPGDDFEILL